MRAIIAIALTALGCESSVPASSSGADIVRAARQQVGKTLHYDRGYKAIPYPNGDVPIERGVCTDVVIRALRSARRVDLQKMVHEDMRANFASYPSNWGLKRPDSNIDHRRVPNLETYFKRRGWSLSVTSSGRDYEPGDIVACILPGNLTHIMVVSDRIGVSGNPMVVHNIGMGTKEEDRLFEFRITGHFRFP